MRFASSFWTVFVCLWCVSTAIAYQLNANYRIKLNNGKLLEGKLIRVDSTTVVIEDFTKSKQTIRRSEIVQATRATRTYTMDDLQKLPNIVYESKIASENEARVSRTYGGKSEEYWISETLRFALQSKQAEESYDYLTRECRSSKDQATCLKASQTFTEIESLRKQYNQLLADARRASAPIAWLETHYKWVRWGKEWKN